MHHVDKKGFVMPLRRAWNESWPAQVPYLPTTSYLNSAKPYVYIKRDNRLITASVFNIRSP